jgi:hypothetical protein
MIDPNELRIVTIRNELHELQIAAEQGNLDDAQTAELGNITEHVIRVWHRAISAMIKRMGAVELVQCPSCDALVPLAEAHHHES